MYPTHLLPHRLIISHYTITLAFIICALLLPFSAQAEKSAPVITVGSEIDFPLYAIADAEGRASGFSVELFEAVVHATSPEGTCMRIILPASTTGNED